MNSEARTQAPFEVTADAQRKRTERAKQPLGLRDRFFSRYVEAESRADNPFAVTLITSGIAKLRQEWDFDNHGNLVRVQIFKELDWGNFPNPKGYLRLERDDTGKFQIAASTKLSPFSLELWSKEFSTAEKRIKSLESNLMDGPVF